MASCTRVYSLAILKWLLQLQASHLDGTQEADELSGTKGQREQDTFAGLRRFLWPRQTPEGTK